MLYALTIKVGCCGLLRAQPGIDRAARLRGNLAGLADIMRRRVEPERARLLPEPEPEAPGRSLRPGDNDQPAFKA